jgi:hypothetical protein
MIIVQDIIETKKPSNSKAEVVLISILVGFILALISVFIREIMRKV